MSKNGQLESSCDLVKYATIALRIGAHSPFGPKFPEEFVPLDPKKYLGRPNIQLMGYCWKHLVNLFSRKRTSDIEPTGGQGGLRGGAPTSSG